MIHIHLQYIILITLLYKKVVIYIASFDQGTRYPPAVFAGLRPAPYSRTVFSLSRATAGAVGGVDMSPTGNYFPEAYIVDWPLPDPTGATRVDLTVISSGAPAAGEILIDLTEKTTTVQTADLTAEETGDRQLVVRHYPLRRQKLLSMADSSSPGSDVLQVLTFGEIITPVDYDEIVQL